MTDQEVRKNGEMFADPNSPDRLLSVEEAASLQPGQNHYRAYVGPPGRYDFMGATQFSLLFQLGVRDHHKILDFGCGSLRLGKLLIPYLQSNKYFGIDPNQWLMDDALTHELGQGVQSVKQPTFSNNTDFNCDVFGEKFDVIMAQSILTHTGIDLFNTFLESAKSALSETGIILFTYFPVINPPYQRPLDGWHYPECVHYDLTTVDELVNASGLVGKALPWYHQVTTWYCAAKDPDQLPGDEHLHHLTGAVLRSEQFTGSLQRGKMDE